MPELREKASVNSKLAQDRQSKYYDAKRRDVQYEIGDKVWKRNRILSSAIDHVAAKLAPKYAGPYFIAARLGSNVYELVDQANTDAGKVHVVDLKPFHDTDNDSVTTEVREELLKNREESPEEILTQFLRDDKEEPAKAASGPAQNAKKRGRPRKTRILVAREKRNTNVLAPERNAPELEANHDSDSSEDLPAAPPMRVVADVHSVPAETSEKRPRGRPKGAKNKGIAPPSSLSPRRTRAKTRAQND